MTTQVCQVHKPLLSVDQLNRGGKVVVLDGVSSYIWDKATGLKEKIRHQGGVHELDLYVPVTAEAQKSAGFLGQT